MTAIPIAPTDIRFIKLGVKGCWERPCLIEEEPTIRLDYKSPHHEASLAKNWDVVTEYWLSVRTGEHRVGTVTRDIKQITDFYELDSNTLWITFYNRKLWWCFAQPEVLELKDKSRIRHTVSGWSCKDIRGRELTVQNLDGRVTTVQGFRGTICGIQDGVKDYLINRINGANTKDVDDALGYLADLTDSIKRLIKGLWWKDFELLTDLIFSQEGWQRTSELGKTQKSIDLDMLSPVTGRRAYVQVKSRADLPTLRTSIEEFEAMEAFDEFFFVVHTTDVGIQNYANDDPRIHVMDLDRIAALVINAGLVRWLINKRM